MNVLFANFTFRVILIIGDFVFFYKTIEVASYNKGIIFLRYGNLNKGK